MDPEFSVHDNSVVYIERGRIAAVRGRADPPPAGFEAVPVVRTAGTLFPGLIDLHNHLSYDALPLWTVPRRFTNRDQWGGTADYRRLISGPMTVVGKTPSLLPALVRYVECKGLLGGVTTTQGLKLASNNGVQRFYRGIVRNVEQTNEADLPEAKARIPDIEAKEVQAFLARLRKETCLLLHLSEGTTATARRHFLALHVSPEEWAITPALAGIHCAALLAQDFAILAAHGGAMVWSPLSNLLLYGETARVDAAVAAGIRVGLGSDWSPSGSKNLLGELKAARLASARLGGLYRDRDLVSLVTRQAAAILGWTGVLGTIEAGKRADVLVLAGASGDPYEALIRARETAIRLVLINGIPRYGEPALMRALGADGEPVRVGGTTRQVFLAQATADPDVNQVSLRTATETLREAFQDLPRLARELERPPPAPRGPRVLDRPEPVVWTLALDELPDTGMELRPRLPLGRSGTPTGPHRGPLRASSPPLSTILGPIALDPLTVVDDPDYLDVLRAQPNLPAGFAADLARLY